MRIRWRQGAARRAGADGGSGTGPGGLREDIEVDAAVLAGLARRVAGAVEALGVPELEEEEEEDLVLVIDRQARPVADVMRLVLPQVPEVMERSGQEPRMLQERDRQVSHLVGLERLARAGERACRQLQALKNKVEMERLERLAAQVRAELERREAAGQGSMELLKDAGELLEALQGRRERAAEAAHRSRQEREAAEEALARSERQTRALRTMVAVQAGERVSDEEAEEALAYLEALAQGVPPPDGPAPQTRRVPR